MNSQMVKFGLLILFSALGLLLLLCLASAVSVDDSAAEVSSQLAESPDDVSLAQEPTDKEIEQAFNALKMGILGQQYDLSLLQTGVGFTVDKSVSEDLKLSLIRSDSGCAVVKEVQPGGSAWYVGVQSGDVILAIDGTSTASLSPVQLAGALLGETGKEVALTFESDLAQPVMVLRKQVPSKKVTVGLGIGIAYAERIDGKPQLAQDELSLPETDDQGFPIVSVVLDGKSASRGGIRVGDSINHVDGQSTLGWSINKLVETLRGEAGETRTLGIEDRKTDVVVEITPLN